MVTTTKLENHPDLMQKFLFEASTKNEEEEEVL